MNTSWLFRTQIETSISEFDRWYVQLDGRPVAIIENPTDADMFWFTWDVVPLIALCGMGAVEKCEAKNS